MLIEFVAGSFCFLFAYLIYARAYDLGKQYGVLLGRKEEKDFQEAATKRKKRPPRVAVEEAVKAKFEAKIR